MEYELIRQKRKTVSLQIGSEGELIVKAPLKTPIKFINDFVISKHNWIEKHRGKTSEMTQFKNSFDFSSKIYIFGKGYAFSEIDLALLGATEEEQNRYYLHFAKQELPKMAQEISSKIGLTYKTLKMTASHRVWGSYDRKGNMKLNYRLVILPKELINYVIIHEFCHSKQLNHSKAFWELVERYCPEYRKCKKRLELYSFLLQQGLGL